jgi:hypothetical protein
MSEPAQKWDGPANPTKGCFETLENKSGNDCLPPLDGIPGAFPLARTSS